MKSYETIKKISSTLYLDLKDESDINNRLNYAIQEIHFQISEDFKDLFGYELDLVEFHIYIDDESYRQSATGLILDATICNNKRFKIRVEYLIDHGKIWIKVIEGKEIPDFAQIVKRIECAQNYEGLTELKEIE